jgi:hypothetical protein
MKVIINANVAQAPRRGAALFAVAGALIFSAVVAGFAPSFYQRFLFPPPPLNGLVRLHGLLMFGWLTLFLLQIWLVKKGRSAIHRRTGWCGLGLMIGVVVVGAYIAIRSAARAIDFSPTPTFAPLASMEYLLILLVLFAIFVSAAVCLRRNRGYHMRLMLLACLDISGPGVSRIPFRMIPGFSFLGDGGPLGLFSFDLLLLYGCMIADALRDRRLHPAFIIGAVPLMFIETPLFSTLLDSAPSVRLGAWIVSLVR